MTTLLFKYFPNIEWNKKIIEWEYFKNPFGKAKVFLALSNHKLVGLSTSIPIKMQMNNKIFDGRVKAALIPKERSVDIDDEIDFKMAELLMRERQEKANA